MATAATLTSDGFNRLIGDLVDAGGPGTNSEAALRGEIGSLLKVCIDYTPQATSAKIRARSIYRFDEKYGVRGAGDLKLTYNTGDRGGNPNNVWLRSGGRFHIMVGPGKWPARGTEKSSRISPSGAHWPDWLWAQYQALEAQTPEERKRLQKEWIARALASKGLARLSWLSIADTLGIEVPGVRVELRQARASDGRTYQNGVGHNVSTKRALAYDLVNSMPALTGGLDGPGIITRAVRTRETAFQVALEKGLFDDITQVAKRYPGLLTF